jgi:hypothetical protein
MPTNVWSTEGKDIREQSRYHVNMIMGNSWVLIVDRKHKPALRTLRLDVDEVISESNYKEIFTDVVEALSQSGNIGDDETASCITFPAGTTVHQVEAARA